MFENILNFFKKMKKDKKTDSKDTAKERLHLVLMQDRANVSADFLELMKQEIIDVIKKYIDVDENSIDVKLTNKSNADGTNGAPILYANIPIISIKDENKSKIIQENDKEKEEQTEQDKESKEEQVQQEDQIKENEETENIQNNEETSKIEEEQTIEETNDNKQDNNNQEEKSEVKE